MSIKITRFHKFEKGSLYGFADISIPVWGTEMTVRGCKVFNKNGEQWVTLPSREYQNDQGETKYQPLIALSDDAVYKKFTDGLMAAWQEYCQKQATVPQNQPTEPGVPF